MQTERMQRTSFVLNTFEMCKKGEIKQDKIQIKMHVETVIEEDDFFDDEDDYDLIDRCESLLFTVEIGETHERDKFPWFERC